MTTLIIQLPCGELRKTVSHEEFPNETSGTNYGTFVNGKNPVTGAVIVDAGTEHELRNRHPALFKSDRL
jgi:hypothetical protein